MDTKGAGAVGVLLFLTLFAVFTTGPVADHNTSVQYNEPTSATILETDVDMRVNDDEREYRPVVVYEYTVDGETYREDNVYPGRFTRWHDSRFSARDVVDAYDVGGTVTVHYNPEAPAEAYLRNDGWPSAWLVSLGYVIVAFAGGGYLIRQGFLRWRQRQLIRSTPTETAQALSIGPSELTGTAITEDRDPVRAPFSAEHCVVAEYEIEQYDDDDDGGGSWKTIESGVRHTPFYIDDGTGTVLLRPHGDATYDLDPDDWTTTRVDSSNRGPEPIQRFVRNSSSVSFPSHASGTDNDRRYKQNLIQPGDSVYVFGTVQPRDRVPDDSANADRLVVQHVEDDAMREPLFLISDDDEASLIDRRRWALWRVPVGAFFLTIGFLVFLLVFAPLLGLDVPRWFDGIIDNVS